ncbi:MAG: TlpA family protein disulfide reductase [Rhodanobacteraceae bacterium]|jgi:thiol-disulfide isomerase/thioredoxin|nr:TlpA family protein disulfide reductase [Rhodanobacteraceae bacterium]MBL0042211.1 TlpA family protein disulfide reductase [Xanthomonadales bacterium]MBP6078275.1 TlpA family protein disulfide reductase [Xanthomonadales bacterium]MBP7623812.1 TlpA family protein disulfide reductase [Xanthomonadales bacterium]
MKSWLLLLASVFAVAAEAADVVPAPKSPSLIVTTLDHGEFDLAKQRGHWVLVNFWATWCSPCLKEIPDFSAFDQARDDVVVVGLAFEEIEEADLRAFLKEHPASYPIARVDVFDPPKDFDVPRGLPTSWLIAPDGTVAEKYLGPITSADLARRIDQKRP